MCIRDRSISIDLNLSQHFYFTSTNLSGKTKKLISEHSSAVSYHPYVSTNLLPKLSITVSRERRTLLSSRGINKRITPTKLAEGKSVASYPHDFAAKHICRKMLHSASFFLSLKENWSDSVDTLRSLSCLILCWNEKEKQLRSCSVIYRPRKKPKSSWNIPSYMKSIDKWILDLLAKDTCLAKKKWSHKRVIIRCCVLSIRLLQLHYQNYLSQFQGSDGHFYQIGA